MRDVSRRRPELTQAFVEEHLPQLSGLTLREGSKHLPAAERDALLERYRVRVRRRP